MHANEPEMAKKWEKKKKSVDESRPKYGKLKLTKEKPKKITQWIWSAPKRIMSKRAWLRVPDMNKKRRDGVDYVATSIGPNRTQVYLPVIFESVNEDLYYGYYKNKEVKVNAKSDKDAKKQIISKLKIPKGDLERASMINHTKNNPVAEGKANIYGVEYRKVGQSGAKFQKSSLTMVSHQGRKMHKKMTMAIIKKAEKLRKQDNWADYRITVNGAPYIGWGGKAITGYPPPKLNEAPGKSGKDGYFGQAMVKVEPHTYKNQKRNFHDVSMYRDHKKPYNYYLSIRLAHSNKVDMVIDTGTHILKKAGKWAQGFIKRRMSGTGNERFS